MQHGLIRIPLSYKDPWCVPFFTVRKSFVATITFVLVVYVYIKRVVDQ